MLLRLAEFAPEFLNKVKKIQKIFRVSDKIIFLVNAPH